VCGVTPRFSAVARRATSGSFAKFRRHPPRFVTCRQIRGSTSPSFILEYK
jgi:hypothetical protein